MFLLDQTEKDAGIIFWKKFAFLCSEELAVKQMVLSFSCPFSRTHFSFDFSLLL